jgi:hypothetical protein
VVHDERALKADPRDAGVYQAYALYVAELGDVDSARDLLRARPRVAGVGRPRDTVRLGEGRTRRVPAGDMVVRAAGGGSERRSAMCQALASLGRPRV